MKIISIPSITVDLTFNLRVVHSQTVLRPRWGRGATWKKRQNAAMQMVREIEGVRNLASNVARLMEAGSDPALKN